MTYSEDDHSRISNGRFTDHVHTAAEVELRVGAENTPLTPLQSRTLSSVSGTGGFVNDYVCLGNAVPRQSLNHHTINQLIERGLVFSVLESEHRGYLYANRNRLLFTTPAAATSLADYTTPAARKKGELGRLKALASIHTNYVAYLPAGTDEGSKPYIHTEQGAPTVPVRTAMSLMKAGHVEALPPEGNSRYQELVLTPAGRELVDEDDELIAWATAEADIRRAHLVSYSKRMLGHAPIKGGGPSYGTSIRCSCGWTAKSNMGQRDSLSTGTGHLEDETDQLIAMRDAGQS